MSGLFLTCCVRGMEVTRHFTPELGTTVVLMLAFAVVMAGLLLVASPLLLRRRPA
jgi:Mg/Co/Ni transporter MgtE